MNDQVNADMSSEVKAGGELVPDGHILVAFKYNFRRFPNTAENLQAQIPVPSGINAREIKYQLENKKDAEGLEIVPAEVVFKRETETYRLPVPTPQALGFNVSEDNPAQIKVLQSMISTLIDQYGRALVNDGILLTPENCNWDIASKAEAERLAKVGTSAGGVTYSKELLDEVAESFGEYLAAIGKPVKGIDAMTKMITGRFGILSVRKYIKGLDLVKANIEGWYADHLDEQQQTDYLEVTQYLLERLEAAKVPEVVDTASLF